MTPPTKGERVMVDRLWLAVLAPVLYGLHQVFTRLAADRIGDGVGSGVDTSSEALHVRDRAYGAA